ncbi:unnamed protein product [Nesidiocoris tenuis]|uniref:Uncharacterized protein n=1 Tax=Nesidiocoris tenuis TaxID=355587 RepID=A0A6H5H572_9HEMI|nr:unnamed protein product [Nesidiocoris tenuis]
MKFIFFGRCDNKISGITRCDPTGNDRPLCKDGNTASFSRPLRLQLGLRLRTNTIISCFESESSVQLALVRDPNARRAYLGDPRPFTTLHTSFVSLRNALLLSTSGRYFRQNSPPTRPIIEKPKQISHLHHRPNRSKRNYGYYCMRTSRNCVPC